MLAFDAGGGPSPGTARTSVEGLAKGGRARINGEIASVPLAWKVREFTRADGTGRVAMSIPWGDVYTAFVSTGIANIETYMTAPPKTITRLRWLNHLRWLLRMQVVQKFLQNRAGQTAGPDAARRRRSGCQIWGEVRNAAGRRESLSMLTPNGYELTVTASLGIVQHLLATPVAGGYYTPSKLMGMDYVLGLPGVKLLPDAGAVAAS
jgi:short subunit dehydrogenase-like uncharacterized protein